MASSYVTRLTPVLLAIVSLGLAGCGPNEPATKNTLAPTSEIPTKASATSLTIIGTNDLHGHIEMLPLFGGYLNIVRSHPERAVLLLDGGDMFQGTLASNLREGAPIVAAYNLLGYDAATIGNHEFDFGPVGPAATASLPGQDPRGAIKARAAQARFPFLSSNIFDDATGAAVSWPNVQPAVMHEVGGIKVGIVGVSTFETPNVILPANFIGLSMEPLAARISEHAGDLRQAGAQAVVVVAHAGGDCKDFSNPKDLATCKTNEIMEVAAALPMGSVDVIVAGHTHQAMAHEVNGIAIIESFSYGEAFGRVDMAVAADGMLSIDSIFPPRALCSEGEGPTCAPGEYEGSEVLEDAEVAALAKKAAGVAEDIRAQDLGIVLPDGILSSRNLASPLGDLFTDLMLAARPDAGVAITNGGGLRADLPAGALNYGGLFEALPFDNRFALVRIKGRVLRALFSANLERDNGILSVSGLRVKARCKSGELFVSMTRANGKTVRDEEVITIVTSDFLASGGDGLIGSEGLEALETKLDDGALMRDAMAEQFRKRGGELRSADFFDSAHPRIDYVGERPVVCK
ncbi:MAG: bifunctional metallophosphatase/5'-nucleotidase [Myxococcales bacterium]|nr:bifunctional metallophosphatase/5'-nucleotidase [Myxococcales bacterium]